MRAEGLALVLLVGSVGCAAPPQTGPAYQPAARQARLIQPVASPHSTSPSSDVEVRLLGAHNAERADTGVPALQWSDDLEAEARVWARQLLATNSFAHDPARHGHGENLWTGWGDRTWTPEEMVGQWIAEKSDYRPGVFPNVSRTGDWRGVGHYTQLVWRDTTHVGCALESLGDRSVLACRYSPPGNVDGRQAY